MRKIKVVGEFELLSPYIPRNPEFKGDFTSAIDALHIAVLDAWNNVKKAELKVICEDAERLLQDPSIQTDFREVLTSLELLLSRACQFKGRSALKSHIEEVRNLLDTQGKGPQNLITRSLFHPITEAAMLDRVDYNDQDDLLVIVCSPHRSEGLAALVRVLPYVQARNTVLVQTTDGWIEEAVEPYLNGIIEVFQSLLGVVTSVQDDTLLNKLNDLFESAQE